MNNLTIGLSL